MSERRVSKRPEGVPHIVEFWESGWMVIHTIACRGDLRRCPVTELVQDLKRSPAIGRWEAWAIRQGDDWRLVLGLPVPPEVEGTSRRIGTSWPREDQRPEGIEFDRRRQYG